MMATRSSFEGDLIVNAEVPDDIEVSTRIVPIKKLDFDDCLKSTGAENMKVFLRIRPLISSKSENTISVLNDNSIITSAPETSKRAQYTKKEERQYTFHKVFGPDSTQSDVFESTALPLFEKFMNGEDVLIFAYGMTNAGKTYTIQGHPSNEGIYPRLMNLIHDRMPDLSQPQLSVSMLEIYQEKLFDLLGSRKDSKLSIRDANGKVEVANLSSHAVGSTQEATRLLNSASEKRAKSHTFLNAGSSRSHAVYSITLSRKVMGRDCTSVFQVVDLAGSERGNRTKASAVQQREANNINMSLMQLWRCLQLMKKKSGPGEPAGDVIPFRESKLTHLLVPSMCRVGLDGIALVACVNPQVDDYDETISILGNASLACRIKEVTDIGRVMGSQQETAPVQSSSDSSVPGKKRKGAAVVGQPNKRSLAAAADLVEGEVVTHSALSNSLVGDADSLLLENKRLRQEVKSLREENDLLMSTQHMREQKIRDEVSREMMERGEHLLRQIEVLQNKLYTHEDTSFDITQSCRKLRKRQLDEANMNDAQHLEEAELEIGRMKAAHEAETAELRSTIGRLQRELQEAKLKILLDSSLQNAGALSPRLALNSASNKSGPSSPRLLLTSIANTICNNTEGLTLSEFSSQPVIDDSIPDPSKPVPSKSVKSKKLSVASEFSKRMQRDGRFNNANVESTSSASISKSNSSPKRSPLMAIKVDRNSPVPASFTANLTEHSSQSSKNHGTLLLIPEKAPIYSPSPRKENDRPIIDRQKLAVAQGQASANDTAQLTNGPTVSYLKKLRSHVRV